MSLSVGSGDLLSSLFWNAHAAAPSGGIIFVSGVDGGWIEPSDRIYQRVADELTHQGVASVFLRYRKPGELAESLADALAGAGFLRDLKVKKMALVGWSFGGSVIAHAAVRIPETVTVVGFAPQSKDTEPVALFSHQSLLLIHSRDDENVPFESSEQILDEAPLTTKKRLIALEGYDHLLTGAGNVVQPEVVKWLQNELGLAP